MGEIGVILGEIRGDLGEFWVKWVKMGEIWVILGDFG